ncbi:hypothetical protein JW868_03730 [Candidatus Woesearchaeota archaeon]|nr:hypothetical protein [Candidatus Woesearchaeota archaeon]
MQAYKKKDTQKRNQIVIGIFFVFLMVFSILGVSVGNRSQNGRMKYGDVEITPTNYGYWEVKAKVDGSEIVEPVNFLPLETMDIDLPDNFKQEVLDKQSVIITFDPGMDPGSLQYVTEIRLYFNTIYDVVAVPGITLESEDYEFPVLDCSNSTAFQPALVFEPAEIFEFESVGTCLKFKGNAVDFAKVRDRILYEYLGVFDEE